MKDKPSAISAAKKRLQSGQVLKYYAVLGCVHWPLSYNTYPIDTMDVSMFVQLQDEGFIKPSGKTGYDVELMRAKYWEWIVK